MKKIKTTFYTIETNRYKKETEKKPLVLFCLSDLHGNVYEPENRPVIECAAFQRPDLILASGDMLSGESTGSDETASALLFALLEIAPVCFVDGNHEIQVREKQGARYDRFIRRLKNRGICVVNNDAVHFELGGRRVAVYGYELPWGFYRRFNRKRPALSDMKKSIGVPDADEYNILLTHNPVFFQEYARWGADFVFAGHLHGGFIRLPFLGGIISPQFQIFPKYDKGLFELGRSQMVVSAGMGNHSWLFRVNNPAEMIVVKVKDPAAGSGASNCTRK